MAREGFTLDICEVILSYDEGNYTEVRKELVKLLKELGSPSEYGVPTSRQLSRSKRDFYEVLAILFYELQYK